jgi:IclR family transcriptional regulator, acetate operon repressor
MLQRRASIDGHLRSGIAFHIVKPTETALGRISTARRDGAVERSFAVLEALINEGHHSSLGSVAAKAGLARPTAHRLLQTLIFLGYARQDSEGLYAPDLKLLRLATHVQETLDSAEVARPFMRELQELLPETVHFALLQDDHAVYVEKLEGRRAYRMASTVGMPLNLHSTAIGKAILAFLPSEDRLQRLGPFPLPRRTWRTLTQLEELEIELARIRESGYAIDDEENEEQIRCLGAAAFDHKGNAIGGLSLSAPAFGMPLEKAHGLGTSVVLAAANISLGLGARIDQLPGVYAEVLAKK